MSIAVLGDHFYRLHASSVGHGIAVEERESLPELLAALEVAEITLTRHVSTEPGVIRFEGASRDGNPLQISISYYRRVDPPAGWDARLWPGQEGG